MKRFTFFLTIKSYWILFTLLACGSGERIDFSKLNAAPEGKFGNPVYASGPDPWVIQKEDIYYVTHTTGNSLKLYKTKRLSELAKSESKIIWTPPGTGKNSKNIWAPEIHFINNKWYFYYAADDGNNDNHRLWVLENSAADPLTGTWVDKGKLQLPSEKWAIDGTVFQLNGVLYFLWSGWEADVNIKQNIYIAKMENPWTASGERILLSQPEYSWELKGGPPYINEGPEFLMHGNKMFIAYSAATCWSEDYALGLLTADTTSDPLTAASWSKSPQPVFVKNPNGKVFGPGHNSFFKSPDGKEDWLIYHANAASGDGCGDKRSIRMQKFSWNTDDTPAFGEAVSLGTFIDIPSEKK